MAVHVFACTTVGCVSGVVTVICGVVTVIYSAGDMHLGLAIACWLTDHELPSWPVLLSSPPAVVVSPVLSGGIKPAP